MAWAALALVLLLFWPSGAQAEKRVALVIGNGTYQKVSKLPNPGNDAKAIVRSASEKDAHGNRGLPSAV
jgi:hypothetical protein